MKLDIAEGKYRNSKNWKNKTVTWEEFKNRCSEPHRTSETMKEYLSETPERQSEIKDCCGAFVGANLLGGSRSKKDVVYRSMLTLDADFATTEFWEDCLMFLNCTALIYSTHKHTPEKPRLRLCIPFSRHVTVAEYEPIARMIAKKIGIEQIDPTTYDVNRLMYYPSASKDGEYIFEYIDRSELDPDTILNKYGDWSDAAQWPTSSIENKIIRSQILKKGNPTEIKGIVGAYCRTYSIEEVLEGELSDVYTKSDIEGRYSYIGGSTSNGLYLVDGVFAHSFHSTDPAGGKSWNAFDLVRVHRFGHLDDNVAPTTNFNKYPSHLEMEDYARKDKQVRLLLFEEKSQGSIKSDFEESEDVDDSWKAELDFDRKGNLLVNSLNIDIILDNDPNLKGKIRLNSFSGFIDVTNSLPWDAESSRRDWVDLDMSGLRNYFARPPYSIKSNDAVKDSFLLMAKRNSYNPLKEYLDNLVWDKEPRVNTILTKYFGAEITELNSAFTRKWMVGAVARVFRPGVTFHNVLVLVGLEGKGKSTFFRKLGQEWFSDTFNFNMLKQGVRAYEQIQNKWIVEIPEMAGLKKDVVDLAKSFISSEEDFFRSPYKEMSVKRPRQCVLGASSNRKEFLISKTGDRRFWPVDVDMREPDEDIFAKDSLNTEEVNQLWAEAVNMFKKGETVFLSKRLEKEARLVQLNHSESDDASFAIDEFLNSLVPENWHDRDLSERLVLSDFVDSGVVRDRVCAPEIALEGLGYSPKDIHLNKSIVSGIHEYMRTNPDWVESKSKLRFKGYGVLKGYLRKKVDVLPH